MDIEAGQVWVVKAGENDGGEAGEPVMVDRFDRGYIDYFTLDAAIRRNWRYSKVKQVFRPI